MTRFFEVGESGAVSSLETLLHDGPLTPEEGITIINQMEIDSRGTLDPDILEMRRMAIRAVGVSSEYIREAVLATVADFDEELLLRDLDGPQETYPV